MMLCCYCEKPVDRGDAIMTVKGIMHLTCAEYWGVEL